jgi:predicted O-methyltransferase YrrM
MFLCLPKKHISYYENKSENDFLNILNTRAFNTLNVPNDWTVDDQGWMDEEFLNVFKTALEGKTDTLNIIEVGTWKGKSAITMIKECLDKNIKPRIVTVDTWLGAPEFWSTQEDSERDLGFIDGYPSVFYTFTRNIKSSGFSEYVFPLPISSFQGADVLQKYGFSADIIYIDGAHEYDAVKSDIFKYIDLLKPGGIMLGDDYNWPGVKKAVDELGNFKLQGRVWWITKN